MSFNKEARKQVVASVNRAFAREVADYGNERLGHLWHFSETDVIKVLVALNHLAEAKGKEVDSDVPAKPLAWYAPAKRLEWYEPEENPVLAARFEVWRTWVSGAIAGG
ncbi:MAG: hypothetical protein Q8O05_01145 [Chloroflexota bacterium]|nr:hypothetical protein [Chloroflexota bacterium]